LPKFVLLHGSIEIKLRIFGPSMIHLALTVTIMNTITILGPGDQTTSLVFNF